MTPRFLFCRKKERTPVRITFLLVYLNRLAKRNQLNIDFVSDVRQSKEPHEPKTCVGDVRRLCDSHIRSRDPLHTTFMWYIA